MIHINFRNQHWKIGPIGQRMLKRCIATLVIVAHAVTATACSNAFVKSAPVTTEFVDRFIDGRDVDVRLNSGQVLQVEDVFVRNDVLIGNSGEQLVRIPLADIKTIHYKKIDPAKTAAAIALTSALVVGFFYFVLGNELEDFE